MTKRRPHESPDDTPQIPTAPLPASGTGPLAGYPVPPGATHCRVHPVGDDGRIAEAIALGHSPDGPVTRISVTELGSAELSDVLTAGSRIRVVFTRYHGDQLRNRIGQGAIWTVPARRDPPREPAPPPAQPTANESQALFLVLRELQREARSDADARAARELGALRELYATQAAMTRDYFAQMTGMFLSERRDERQHTARERARDARVIDAARAAAREELAEREDDDEEAVPDVVGQAVAGLAETVKPIASELTRRMLGGGS